MCTHVNEDSLYLLEILPYIQTEETKTTSSDTQYPVTALLDIFCMYNSITESADLQLVYLDSI